MMTPIQVAEGALDVIFCVVALMGNAFIVTMNVSDWIKIDKDISMSNVLVTILGVHNICLQCMFMLLQCANFFIEFFVNMEGVVQALLTTYSCLHSSSLWVATWLCAYYCIMIVKWSHPFYIWLRMRYSKVVPWLLCCSLLVSLTNIFRTGCYLSEKDIAIQMSWVLNDTCFRISSNATTTISLLGSGCYMAFIISALVAFVAFAIFSFSAGAIVTSLYRHLKRMSQSGDSFRNPRLNAHLGAMKTVTMLLILYISNYLVYCIFVLRVFTYSSIVLIPCRLVSSAFPAMSSSILINGNPSLKKTLGQILRKICCRGEALVLPS